MTVHDLYALQRHNDDWLVYDETKPTFKVSVRVPDGGCWITLVATNCFDTFARRYAVVQDMFGSKLHVMAERLTQNPLDDVVFDFLVLYQSPITGETPCTIPSS